jgi:hypothetical protein
MVEMVMVLVGLWLVIVFASFCVWILEMGKDCEDWRKNVTAEDLEELGRLFEKEGSFVGYNDTGEKFLVGYSKDN